MHAVFVKDNIAYCAGGQGWSIFDVSDPATPNKVGGFVSNYAYGVYVSGFYAYGADWDGSIRWSAFKSDTSLSLRDSLRTMWR